MFIKKIGAYQRPAFKSLSIRDSVYHNTLLVINNNSKCTSAAVDKAKPALQNLANGISMTVGYDGIGHGTGAELWIKCKKLFAGGSLLEERKYHGTPSVVRFIGVDEFHSLNLAEKLIAKAKDAKIELLGAEQIDIFTMIGRRLNDL